MGNALKGWLFIALMFGWPLYFLPGSFRADGWREHQDCIERNVRNYGLTTAKEVLKACEEMP